MNKLLLIVFVLYHNFTTAQIVPPPTPIQSNTMLSNTEVNVLYRDWENKIKIVKPCGYNTDKVKVSCSGCSISSALDKEGNYTATVGDGNSKTALIKVSAIDDNGNNVELSSETFRIFNLPLPTVYFGGKAGGTLNKATAISIPKLTAKLVNSPLNVPYEVVEFSMIYTTNGGSPVRIRARGNRLSSEMQGAIKKIPKGGNLTFIEIKVTCPNGNIYSLNSGLVLRLI